MAPSAVSSTSKTCQACNSVSSRGKEGPAGSQYANTWYCAKCWTIWEGKFNPDITALEEVQASPARGLLQKSEPGSDKCMRPGCAYLKHSLLGISFCCRACADSGEHGPACERRRCKPAAAGDACKTAEAKVLPQPAAASAVAGRAQRTAKTAGPNASTRSRVGSSAEDDRPTLATAQSLPQGSDEYAVVANQVFYRNSPSLNGEKLGRLERGATVTGMAKGGWLCLDVHARMALSLGLNQAAFVLIDGSDLKLGKLLELRTVRPPCGAFSKDVYTGPLAYTASRSLTVYERPSEESKALGTLDLGKTVLGYPMGEWFELKDRWGWVRLAKADCTNLEPAPHTFRAFTQGKFAEAMLFGWNALPANNVSYDVEWAMPEDADWDTVSREEVKREIGARHINAHIRALEPRTRVIFRVFAHVLLESPAHDPASPLVGTWHYGSKPTKYRIIRIDGGRLKFDGPHTASGRVSGVLEPAGPYLQAEVSDAQGEKVGTIRLRFREEDTKVVSNWKNVSQDEFGKDIVATKGPSEVVLTTLESNWLEEYTGFPITQTEERECRYDPLSNLRGSCQRCACPAFVFQQTLEVANLERCSCRRCGCPCTRHCLLEGYLAMVEADTFTVSTRTWSVDDVAPGEDPVAFVIANIEAAENLYETLGVPHSATTHDVRRAFRAVSLRLHPDKLVGRAEQERELVQKAEIFFKLLSAANEVLSNERQRRDYDTQWQGQLSKEQQAEKQRKKREQQRKRMQEWSEQHKSEPAAFSDFHKGFHQGGFFGQSGLYKEHAGGGFTWHFPGGGSITVDNAPNRAHMSEAMPWEWMAKGKEAYEASKLSPGGGGGALAGGGLSRPQASASPFEAPYRRFEK